ncbi:RdgB/HAM1 family non-canonical purine NTP pyrophosphatase [Leptospira congkakensis]|uniref:dITP/XTP pyrophosphatase n=1 Tax=Leptospira congkakensis TaxID=2484932 RepID=A0A4Z1AIS5_9LEPT|nr:RdgB/HAM1 family non-canonical purine NTP pyrophosphatase [Leptospira congkakensis]TGL88674.1 RdgB/HAM1 family non-canonical purine NTP pyrophosphatase [Leptospira congkakensis]TGL89260.1 RdgB/HAM1 family non-canonical purine NTP pyrophosphatase [Leptospira congkakensis]TGL97228.1 RdgB/HAM1 family non-canonical purine NTP pyrophosphatase [Leptospira congkakensis]
MTKKTLAFASGSAHKWKEMQMLLSPFGYEVVLPKDLGISFSPEETENSFTGNSYIKSKELFRLTGLPSFADDSGISVPALGGEPGVYSARFGGPGLSDKERALYLLQKLGKNPERNAYYSCVVTYVDANTSVSFEGRVDGVISNQYDEEGKYGFGYDPIFVYPPFGKSFSQVPESEKNTVSHRKKAMELFLNWLSNQK